ncbi:transporter substrate-binding domain-containing protein [Rhizobium leguminosarum]|uniref:Transporter substrate-binding domain-containing protein n=1 Tax=Rhizobium leguminosarum TaxID=384 RepID=A0A6P0AYJ3_RHILE|nr:transporter substrate-binding domain-containing protein [Rhizobium leguminosarum]NEI32629.1 transporter substrate-binding domain-containing protein [Rhizobium leguminosarum]NEI39388.1 transporter substrate-binding domain-containing protein [Rhizobium leguminosarum]
MTSLAMAVIATSLTVAVASAAGAEQVRVGFAAEPYPPFSSPDASGNWSGWEVDFMKAMCEAAKLDCVITPVAWDGIIPALTGGKIDMIVGSMTITKERQKSIDFSDKYYSAPPGIVGTKDLKFDATPESLAGKVIGVQLGSIHYAYAHKHFEAAGATVRDYPTQDEANNDLFAGRIDATELDRIAISTLLNSEQGSACCELKGMVKFDPDVLGEGVGVGLRMGDEELKSKVNAAIAEIRKNGTYEALSKRYFDFDIFGG